MSYLSKINNTSISLSNNPVTVYMASLAIGSRRTIENSLRVITQVSGRGDDIFGYPWHELRYQHVQAIRSYLAENYKHTTANKILAILKGVLKECKRLDLMTPIEYDKAVDFKQVKGNSLPTGRWISAEEMDKLIATCDTSEITGLRNRAIFYTLQVGLRRSEVSNLKLEDFSITKSEGRLYGTLKVTKAKGNKIREVPLTKVGVTAIVDYLEASGHVRVGDSEGVTTLGASASCSQSVFDRRREASSQGEGYLFVRSNNKKLTDQSIYNVVKWACEKAGIEDTGVHDFRRSCASNLLDKGVDLVVVQKILGHESVITTARYDRRGIEAQRKAIDLL